MAADTTMSWRGIPLRRAFTALYVASLLVVAVPVVLLSYRAGARAVDAAIGQVRDEVARRVLERVLRLLEIPHRVNAWNESLVSGGLLTLDDPATASGHFARLLELYPELVASSVTLTDGRQYGAARQGFGSEPLPGAPALDPRFLPGYVRAVVRGGEAWTDVYLPAASRDRVVAAVRPLYRNGELEGVLSSSMALSELSRYLGGVSLGRSGRLLILDDDARLLASSAAEELSPAGQPPRATEVPDALTSGAAGHLLRKYPALHMMRADELLSYRTDQGRVLAVVRRIRDDRGIRWFLVVAVPAYEFTAEIDRGVRLTALFLVAGLVAALVMGVTVMNRLIYPVVVLSEAVRSFAATGRVPELPLPPTRELRRLTFAFGDMAGEIGKLVGTLEGRVRERTAELDRANQELERLASLDALTGLSNRRVFFERAELEWKRSARAEGSIAVIMVDIDRFKQFNDRYGHLEGDACLRQVAAAIASVSRRPGDLAARYGGEEFAILLPGTTAEGAERVGQAAVDEVRALGIPHAGSSHAVVTISAGAASLVASPAQTVQGLLARADEALYRAKEEGRSRVVVAP